MAITAICTVDEVKNFLSLPGSKPEDDDLIDQLCKRISKIFATYCDINSFISATYVEYYDGDNNEFLFPKNFPITNIDHLYDDIDWVFDVEFVSGVYKVVDDRYVVLRDDVFTKGNQNIKIEYTAGYTANTMPDDLKQVAIEEVSRRYRRRKEIDLESKTLQDGTVNYIRDSLLPSTKEVLNKYKRSAVI